MRETNLHFKVHKVLRCFTCHETHTSRSTRYCPCHENCTSRPTKHCTCHEIICTSRFTSRSPAKAIDSQQEHFQKNIINAKTELSLETCSENEPHVQKSRLTEPPTKSTHRRKTALISCACHEMSRKVDFGPPNSRAPATKSDHQVRKCAQHPNKSAVSKSTRSAPSRFCELFWVLCNFN